MIELIISNDSCGFELFSNKIAFASNKLSSCDLIEFSKEWISKPLIFSLFTLLCRFGIYYDGKLTEYFEKVFSRNDVPYLDKNDF